MKKKCNIFYGNAYMVIYFTQYILWNSSGQSTGMGSLSLLQGIFPTLGSNPGLPYCRRNFTSWATTKSPRIQKGVGYPFSSGSSWPRNQTQTPELQAESLPTELSGKPLFYGRYSLKMYEQLRRRHRGNKLKLNWVGYRLTQRHWLRQFSFLEINWISFIISPFINLWNLHI